LAIFAIDGIEQQTWIDKRTTEVYLILILLKYSWMKFVRHPTRNGFLAVINSRQELNNNCNAEQLPFLVVKIENPINLN